MTLRRLRRLLSASLGLAGAPIALAAAPFGGTIFLDPDIITGSDPSAYVGVAEAGRGSRWMFDRRVNDWVYLNAFLFRASYRDGFTIEIQVNPEFGSTGAALQEAARYGPVIGRLPSSLRKDVKTVWIHRGNQPFGGGNQNLLIHTGQADDYVAAGILEETLVHEASHTSLDARHAAAPAWVAAQAADGEFISTYAQDYPDREDIAETFLVYLAVRYRADRISQALRDTIVRTVRHRLAYFDAQPLVLYPVTDPPEVTASDYDPVAGAFTLTWTSAPGRRYAVDMSIDLANWVEVAVDLPSQGSATSHTHTNPPASHQAFFVVRQLIPP